MDTVQPERIEVIVSTMNYRDGGLRGLLESIPADVPVTIVNQVAGQGSVATPEISSGGNVRCISYAETGLSRSRNRLLEHAKGDFLLVCDDDIAFEPGSFSAVRDALQRYPDDDVLTFRMADLDGKPRKRYPGKSVPHGRWSIARVSSCEIGFRRRAILTSGVRYDERFGLGARYPGGEEVVFLKDCLDLGLRLRFVPITISRHPAESTGRRMNEATEFARGALFRQLYGASAWAMGPLFYLKKRVQLGDRVRLASALRAYVRGFRDLAKNHR